MDTTRPPESLVAPPDEFLDQKVGETLDLRPYLLNILRHKGIVTNERLLQESKYSLYHTFRLGRIGVARVVHELAKHGRALAPDPIKEKRFGYSKKN